MTEAESEVLSALWQAGPLTAARLVDAVKAKRSWGEATIKTLMGRLMQKKALLSKRDDGRVLYHPLVSREAYVASEIEALAIRLFDGQPIKLAEFVAERWQVEG